MHCADEDAAQKYPAKRGGPPEIGDGDDWPDYWSGAGDIGEMVPEEHQRRRGLEVDAIPQRARRRLAIRLGNAAATFDEPTVQDVAQPQQSEHNQCQQCGVHRRSPLRLMNSA
jgi:hypothetical protein